MKHIRIQIDPTAARAAIEALEAFAIRHARVDGDTLTVPAHDDALQVERVLRQAGVPLFSYPVVCDGPGYGVHIAPALWRAATQALAMLEKHDAGTADAIRREFAEYLRCLNHTTATPL